MMGKSPVYPKYETSDYGVFDFDAETDFSQFLNEARQHRIDSSFVTSSPSIEHEGRRRSGGEKKGKKSWKSSILSWWKSEKKSKPQDESGTNSSRKPKHRKAAAHTSGPIYGSTIREKPEVARRRPTSGPLSGVFGRVKRSENEMPYITLGERDRSNGTSPYGPLYLVT